jgi:hypothetical protein
MNVWSNAVMTTAGLALQARLVAGTTLNITKVQSGAGTVPVTQLASQTDVSSPKQTLTIRQVTSDANSAALTCYLVNDSLSTGYTATQIGVYAQDPVAGEILYFICQAASGEGTEVPSKIEMPGYTAEWTFYFGFGQADSVSVTVDPANTVSQAQVTTMISTALAGATFNTSQITNGTLPVARGGTGQSSVDTTPTSNSSKMVTSGGVYNALQGINASQITNGTLPVARGGTGQTSVDTTPTSGSSKMVTSGGVYNALQGINTSQITNGTLPVSRGGTGQTSVDTTPTSNSSKMVTSGGVYTALAGKQKTITYGTGAPSGGSNGDVYIRYNA